MRLLAWAVLFAGLRQLFLGHAWVACLGILLWLTLLGERKRGVT